MTGHFYIPFFSNFSRHSNHYMIIDYFDFMIFFTYFIIFYLWSFERDAVWQTRGLLLRGSHLNSNWNNLANSSSSLVYVM
jgi:hypothetical protein